MKFNKRFKLQPNLISIKYFWVVPVLLAFVVVAISSLSAISQPQAGVICTTNNTGCGVYGAEDFHTLELFEVMLGYHIFQVAVEDNNNDDEQKVMGTLFMFWLIIVGFFLQSRTDNILYTYWHIIRHWHIKFWDFLQRALAQGLIHTKTLDCVKF